MLFQKVFNLNGVMRNVFNLKGDLGFFNPASLFTGGKEGVWYDPSDLSTLFQDSTGTTPVTEPGQPVGLMLDKSGNGNHASQATSAARPIYGRTVPGGRRNLLTGTDALATQSQTVTAAQHTLSFKGTGTVTLSGTSTAGPLVGTGAEDVVELTFTPTAGSLTLTVSGTVELAQLELGAARSAYQRVGSIYDVTEAGGRELRYLQSDGDDDSLSASVPWSSHDQIELMAVARPLATGIGRPLLQTSGNINNPGNISFRPAEGATTANFRFRTVDASRTLSTNITGVVTALRSFRAQKSGGEWSVAVQSNNGEETTALYTGSDAAFDLADDLTIFSGTNASFLSARLFGIVGVSQELKAGARIATKQYLVSRAETGIRVGKLVSLAGNWLLAGGAWNDNGIWDDEESWP